MVSNYFNEAEGGYNPLSPEFKIPAEPINAGDKMAAPRREPISLRVTLYQARTEGGFVGFVRTPLQYLWQTKIRT